MSDGWQPVADLSEITDRGRLGLDLEGRGVVLYRIGDSVWALGGTCPHRGAPLSEGALAGPTITCPWHGARFDVRTGARLRGPACPDLGRHEVRIEGTRILVRLLAAPE
ncbi:MAG: hypothetical protein QOJ29_1828 [Thermoleophilaceae bacterium]|jgi:nitrite reductase/ring-hydroxylating ferredoxin subunit|nr:hypothetical protein [Thermoleophilaceae bacterium]